MKKMKHKNITQKMNQIVKMVEARIRLFPELEFGNNIITDTEITIPVYSVKDKNAKPFMVNVANLEDPEGDFVFTLIDSRSMGFVNCRIDYTPEFTITTEVPIALNDAGEPTGMITETMPCRENGELTYDAKTEWELFHRAGVQYGTSKIELVKITFDETELEEGIERMVKEIIFNFQIQQVDPTPYFPAFCESARATA